MQELLKEDRMADDAAEMVAAQVGTGLEPLLTLLCHAEMYHSSNV